MFDQGLTRWQRLAVMLGLLGVFAVIGALVAIFQPHIAASPYSSSDDPDMGQREQALKQLQTDTPGTVLHRGGIGALWGVGVGCIWIAWDKLRERRQQNSDGTAT